MILIWSAGTLYLRTLCTIAHSMKRTNLIMLIGLLLSCGQADNLGSDKVLEDLIKEKVLSGQPILDLDSIARFDWDSIIILTPYANPEDVSQRFKIDLSKIGRTNIQHRDDINVLIFVNDGQPVTVIEYPRYPGDFSTNDIEFIKRSEAQFRIMVTDRRSTTGYRWIELQKE